MMPFIEKIKDYDKTLFQKRMKPCFEPCPYKIVGAIFESIFR